MNILINVKNKLGSITQYAPSHQKTAKPRISWKDIFLRRYTVTSTLKDLQLHQGLQSIPAKVKMAIPYTHRENNRNKNKKPTSYGF